MIKIRCIWKGPCSVDKGLCTPSLSQNRELCSLVTKFFLLNPIKEKSRQYWGPLGRYPYPQAGTPLLICTIDSFLKLSCYFCKSIRDSISVFNKKKPSTCSPVLALGSVLLQQCTSSRRTLAVLPPVHCTVDKRCSALGFWLLYLFLKHLVLAQHGGGCWPL